MASQIAFSHQSSSLKAILNEPMGIVCTFAVGENRGFTRAEPRKQHPTGVLHLIIRSPGGQ